MKTWIRASAIALIGLTAFVTLLMAFAWTMLPLDAVAIRLHDETFSLADLQGAQAALFFVLAVAAVVIGTLAVLAMIAFGLCLAAIGLAVGALATAASLALAAAPFALVGWLLWRLFRTPPAARVVATS